jgi:Fe-S-cluster-containing dehydrogenase component
MSKKLIIDLEKCHKCKECTVKSAYYYEGDKQGFYELVEQALRKYVCRHCKSEPCIKACPKDAIERLEDGYIHRYNMRCIGCQSCVLACFYGVAKPETITYKSGKFNLQDFLGERNLEELTSDCEHASIIIDDPEGMDDTYEITDDIYVHVIKWKQRQVKES